MDETQVDTPEEYTVFQKPESLTCSRCGEAFSAPVLHPLLCCPHCGMIGYADRAGMYLLSIGWDCPACGEANNGLTNFCVSCGTGLPSRCLGCEAPVYKATCDRCGTHQALAQRFQVVETERATWVPIVQAHIRERRAQEKAATDPYQRRVLEGIEWRPIDQPQAPKPAPASSPPQSRRRPGWWGWGWIWIAMGIFFLLQKIYPDLATAYQQGSYPWADKIVAWAASWADFIQRSLQRIAPPNAGDPRYGYLFASLIIGLALLPVLFFLINRLVNRLFP
jgi:hypothetical protein